MARFNIDRSIFSDYKSLDLSDPISPRILSRIVYSTGARSNVECTEMGQFGGQA